MSPLLAVTRPEGLLAVAAVGAALLALAGTRLNTGRGKARESLSVGALALLWLAGAVLCAVAVGVAVGSARVATIDAGALRGAPGTPVELRGTVVGFPRADPDGWTAEVESASGRVLARSDDPDALEPGAVIELRGRLAEAPRWQAGWLRVRGVAMVIETERIEVVGRRGGLAGRVDRIRDHAEDALERGMPERLSALARGFVLGEDDRIDPATREDFRRSGLAHLLAVSGQNVVLLCVLAWPLLALAGLTLRARLLALVALIALYVPLTGAGPSIQRAGIMGVAGLVAALVSRPASRWYALLLAATATLALNPRAAADVGWQLSFAAVAGIFLWSRRLADAIAGGAPRQSPRRALADGTAMTVAATVATAPLVAHHFDALQIAALPANVAALPAVAPAMWLGMLAGFAGQLPAIPVEPMSWLNSLCLAYIAQVARWFGTPEWAQLELGIGRPGEVAAAYAVLVAAGELALAAAARRRGLGPAAGGRLPRRVAIAALGAAAALAVGPALLPAPGGAEPAPSHLQMRALDVGQGDAILLDPPAGAPVLVDTGPPGAGLPSRLRDLGVDALGAVVITHDQSDHAGALAELLRALPVRRLALGTASPRLRGLARASGVETTALAEGGELISGELRLTALWPPRALARAPAEDPNTRSVVLVAEWRHFSALLTGDAEAEAVPLDPGPVDVLKVAHHGSADEGLEALLERTAPKLALISVGENGHGHPAPETLAALERRGIPVMRTDASGEIAIEASAAEWSVAG